MACAYTIVKHKGEHQEDGVALWGPYTKKDAENYLCKINQFNKSGKNIYKIKLDKDWKK